MRDPVDAVHSPQRGVGYPRTGTEKTHPAVARNTKKGVRRPTSFLAEKQVPGLFWSVTMNGFELETSLRDLDGVIERVDIAGRELTVRVGGAPRQFALAPDCELLLHGEPVKLRLLQALDRAHLRYARAGDDLIAYQVRVR